MTSKATKEVTTMPAEPTEHKRKLIAKLAARFDVEPQNMMQTLKATCFKGDVSNEQMMALCIVADQYNLNPWTREIFAFPDKNQGIVPVVSVDGWIRIMNEHKEFDGIEFEQDDDSCTATIFRKDRQHPIVVTEFMQECYRNTPAWNSHKRRMLRHKTLIQGCRIAFGFAGIYDPDEAERIVKGEGDFIEGTVERTEATDLNEKLGLTQAEAETKREMRAGPTGGGGPVYREPGEDDDAD